MINKGDVLSTRKIVVNNIEYEAKRVEYYVMRACRVGYKTVKGWELWKNDKMILGGVSHISISQANYARFTTLKELLDNT